MIGIIDCGTSWLREITKIVKESGHTPKVIRLSKLKNYDIRSFSGIIISGAPTLLTEVDLRKYMKPFKFIKNADIPVLGICLGHQIIGLSYGSKIQRRKMINKKENIEIIKKEKLFSGIKDRSLFRQEHSEFITLPKGFLLLAKSKTCNNEAMKHKNKIMYGVQFHPEVSDKNGTCVLKNFLKLCSKD
ncbi:MAG TPA: gamma-glutamyl-gamma-aminobutyrate hydrolase family protein [Candidatus Nanoarchaeia archaeon]|nr:gamma-glutamyl-gamma-aminobutyrate hydrolase family protein [Candidatus Nanoarchaeia archaeon]